MGKPGDKYDQGKPQLSLLPPKAVIGVSEVLTFGRVKYCKEGWKDVPDAVDRYRDALLRHFMAILDGEDIDPESGLPHIDHVQANAMFLSHFFHSDCEEEDLPLLVGVPLGYEMYNPLCPKCGAPESSEKMCVERDCPSFKNNVKVKISETTD